MQINNEDSEALAKTAMSDTTEERRIYEHYVKHPDELPAVYQHNPRGESFDRRLTDYIAGMTDTYAIQLFQELYIPRVWTVL
jgi:dGTPase